MTQSNLLFVEDDQSFRQAVCLFLGIYHHIETAGTVAEGRTSLNKRTWDVVLLDQTLPDGRGTELIAYAKKIAPGGVVIVLTGDSDFNAATYALSLGADDYVIKSAHCIQELLIRIPRCKERLEILRRLDENRNLGSLLAAKAELGPEGYRDYMNGCERSYLAAALKACGGNVTQAANLIGLGRSTVFKKAADLGLLHRSDERQGFDL